MIDRAMLRGATIHRAESPFYALAAEDNLLYAACGDGSVLAWTSADAERIRLFARAPSSVFALAAVGSGSLAIGTQAGELILLHTYERRPLFSTDARQGAIHAIAQLNRGRIATGGAHGSLVIWEKDGDAALRQARRIPLFDGKLRAVLPEANSECIVATGSDGIIRMLDTDRFNEKATWSGHEGGTTALAFHPTKPVLLSGGKDGHIRVWDLRVNGKELLSIAAHRGTVYALTFDRSGRTLFSASREKTVKSWSAEDLAPINRLDAGSGGHSHSVNALCAMGDDLFSAGDDRRLIRWPTAQSG